MESAETTELSKEKLKQLFPNDKTRRKIKGKLQAQNIATAIKDVQVEDRSVRSALLEMIGRGKETGKTLLVRGHEHVHWQQSYHTKTDGTRIHPVYCSTFLDVL